MNFDAWRQLSPEQAARDVLDRARTRLRPGQMRAVLAWLPDETELAREFAAARAGNIGPLAGVPFFAKDLFDAAGTPTFAGSTFLPEVRPAGAKDGAAVAALRAAGAVFAGKTHLHEFAYGVTGENPHYGDCEHPQFPGRTTGGSSSGSAAAVAAGLVPLALGTDTGGSVRVPAAFCGLFGYRLVPGDAWIRDAFPLAPSFDTAGWFTAEAGDMLAAVAALVSSEVPQREPRGAVLSWTGVESEVSTAFARAVDVLGAERRADVDDELQRGFSGALEAYHTTVAAEAWEVHKGWAERCRERYDPLVWSRLTRAHGLTEGQRRAARVTRDEIAAVWRKFFAAFDYLVLPATPTPALTKAECTLENRNRIISLTAPASIGGCPVLTIPVPLPSGLTTGLQVVVRDSRSAVVPWALRRWSEAAGS